MARTLFLLLVVSHLTLAQPSAAADGPGTHLVSVAWLEKNRERTDVVLLDASPAQAFAAQHVPGAIHVDLFGFGPQEPTTAQIEQRFQAWGVSPGKKVVVYDQGGTFMATWLFYELVYRGFPAADVAILDGGMAKWRAAAGVVTEDPTPVPPRGSFRVTTVHEDLRVRLPEFLVASGDPKANALVEALDPSWYFGETAFFDRPGHVPHAIMLPTGDFFNADKTFKSADEMRRALDHLGVKPEQQIHSYCGGGQAATVPLFALKYLLGYPRVRLYRESQLEWLRDDRGLPFWTYAAPYLMRETGWLKSWGGRMMRMYGVSRVSIVDVRRPQDFKSAHVPFAVNVPAEVFKDQIGRPDKLAEVLGKAGVDMSHEAVVVSDGRIDERSALAFLALETLGQKRTSVFLDSIDRWAELGQAVNREGAADGAKTSASPAEPSIRPTAYAPTPRTNMLVADPTRTQGLYPKVYLASGKDLPARKPDGQVIHVPYTTLLDDAGRPKAAKDIWKILAKAGVPRYAEIVCFADDLGEAAANYFVLKLMGFADVKVWGM